LCCPTGIDEPDLAVVEVSKQFGILLGTHVARPDDFRGIDFRAVVDPFVLVHVVVFPVMDLNEVFAGQPGKSFRYVAGSNISPIGLFQGVTVMGLTPRNRLTNVPRRTTAAQESAGILPRERFSLSFVET
jgi:hypothetical protein